MINISISVTNNSHKTVYSTQTLINNGRTNRNNGSVIVEAIIQVRINLQLEIWSPFRNNFAIMNRIIVSIKIVIIHAIQNFIILILSNEIHVLLSVSSNL